MEVVGRGSVTVVDGSHMETDAYRVRGRRPMMVTGAVLHSIPTGYWFDLRARALLSDEGGGTAEREASE
jgi:cyanophycinase